MQKISKKANLESLTAVGWTLVSFGIIVGLGIVVLQKFGDNIVQCAADKTWNVTTQLCANATGNASGAGGGFSAISYVNTQLGSAGLTGWLPVLIVVIVAGLIFAYFGMRGKTY